MLRLQLVQTQMLVCGAITLMFCSHRTHANTSSVMIIFLSVSFALSSARYLSFRRFCGGLILDVKRKLPFFASDFYDAVNIQALSATLFIYLGTVTNAITFGGLLGDATENMQVQEIIAQLINLMS